MSTRQRLARPGRTTWSLSLAAATAFVSVNVMSPAYAGPSVGSGRAPAEASTVRVGNAYDVYVDGALRGRVSNHEPANAVAAVAAPDGSLAAAVTDHDGHHGAALVVLGAAGTQRTIATGAVTSAAFSADGARLAYVVADGDAATVMVGTPAAAGPAIARVTGMDITVLGWRSDGAALFLQAYPVNHHDSVVAANLLRVDLATGSVAPVLSSDPAHGVVYLDYRLVTVNGTQMVSFIRTGTVFLCGDGGTDIALARTDGTVARTAARTSDTYREATWSEDGARVAYTAQACVTPAEKQAAGSAAAQRADQVVGTYVENAATGLRTQVVTGVPSFRVASLRGSQVHLTSDRLGARSIDAAAIAAGTARATPAAALEPAGYQAITPMARNNTAVQINQIYDTRDAFDGRGSCGPTSSLMDLAGYQLSSWGLYVNYGGTHWSPYGLYITDQYTYGATTFSRAEPDYSGLGSWRGAHGYMYDPSAGAVWSYLYNYLNAHTGWAQSYYGWSPTFVRNQIDSTNLVVAGGTINGHAHFVLIRGYTDDGRWIVNDPFGVNTSGGSGGGNQIYTAGAGGNMNIAFMVGN